MFAWLLVTLFFVFCANHSAASRNQPKDEFPSNLQVELRLWCKMGLFRWAVFGFSFEATKLISFVEPRGEKVGCQEPMDMYDTMDVCHGQSNQPPLLFKAPVSLTKRWQGLVGRAWVS